MLFTRAAMMMTVVMITITRVSGDAYVQEACNVTRYQDLCVQTLAPFSKTARSSPGRWARAGVSVALESTKNVASFLVGLKRHGNMTGRGAGALADCVEVAQDALYNLHRSLGILRDLSPIDFDLQMSNLLTWLSAALTDETACVDGFDGIRGRQVITVHSKVMNVSYITSNALALANWLATSGIESVVRGPYKG